MCYECTYKVRYERASIPDGVLRMAFVEHWVNDGLGSPILPVTLHKISDQVIWPTSIFTAFQCQKYWAPMKSKPGLSSHRLQAVSEIGQTKLL